MPQIDPFLKTKFHIPSIRKELVRRPRLLKRVVEGFQCPLTLVTAPAGYGKTTLVASGLSMCEMRSSWLSLEKADNQVERFFSYLVQAIQQANPEIGKQASEIMQSGQPVDPEKIFSSLINDLAEMNEHLILVLDDYQTISNPVIHESLSFFLDHCPEKLHLAITTRVDPPLPLARYRVRGQVVELRASDLRFTAGEAAQFLNETMDLQLDDKAVQALEDRTEGWIAGLQMAAIAMQSRVTLGDRSDTSRFIAGFSGTNRYILDYLLEEVLANQPPEVQYFLLITSILERMCAPLCDALLTQGDKDKGVAPSVMLEALERTNLFLVTLDDERIWYRYHHLFAELLQVRLAHLYPKLKPELHLRAADWLEKNDLPIEAVNQALLGGANEQAARMVEENTTVLLARGELKALMRWIEALPVEIRKARPRLCIHQAYALAFAGKLKDIAGLLQQAEQAMESPRLDQEEIRSMNGSISAIRAMVSVMAGQDLEGLSLAGHALAVLPADQDWDRSTVAWALGYAERSLGHLTEARIAFEEMVRLARKMGNPWTLVSGLMDLAMVVRSQGQLRAARGLFEEALREASRQGARSLGYIARMEAGLASILYEQNELEAAGQLLNDAAAHIGQWPNPNHLAYACAVHSRVLLAQNNLSGARQAIEQADQVCQAEPTVRISRRLVEAGMVRLWMKTGLSIMQKERDVILENRCTALIEGWRDEIRGPFRESFDEAVMISVLMLARISFVRQSSEDVLMLLGQVVDQAQQMGNVSLAVEALLLTALAQQKMGAGYEKKALVLLEAALQLAQPGGYVRAFLDEGRPLQQLLIRWQDQAGLHPLRDYALHLLASFDRELKQHISEDVLTGPARLLPEPLSQREIEVLTLIAQGLTNDGIARQLIISPGTVKAHTAAIYRKLDVASRTEAVARARQYHLLP